MLGFLGFAAESHAGENYYWQCTLPEPKTRSVHFQVDYTVLNQRTMKPRTVHGGEVGTVVATNMGVYDRHYINNYTLPIFNLQPGEMITGSHCYVLISPDGGVTYGPIIGVEGTFSSSLAGP